MNDQAKNELMLLEHRPRMRALRQINSKIFIAKAHQRNQPMPPQLELLIQFAIFFTIAMPMSIIIGSVIIAKAINKTTKN